MGVYRNMGGIEMLMRGVWMGVWLLIFSTTAFGAVKEKLVLLPLQGKGFSTGEKRLYQGAIKSEWSRKYKIYSGAEVEEKLKKFSISSCSSDECLEQIAIAFNGHLVGRGYVTDSSGTLLLGLEIKDIFTHEDLFSESAGCDGCNGAGIIDMLKSMAAGRARAGGGEVAYISQVAVAGPVSGGIVSVVPTVGGNKTSKIAALFFDSEPSGATVYLGDTVAGITPYQNLSLRPGQTIQVTVKKAGYRDQQVAVTLAGGTNDAGTLRMKSTYGGLSISSTPAGAEVIIAGKKVGTTPYTDAALLSGAYLVSVRKDSYLPVENRRVVVRDEEQTTASFLLEANYGTLDVDTLPSGATFTLHDNRGKPVRSGSTPTTIQTLPGVYTLALTMDGYTPLYFTVTLARNGRQVIDKTQAIFRKPYGELLISSDPYIKGAVVWVDGREAGTVPLSLTLPAGPHEIEVTTDDKVGTSRVVVIDGGADVVKLILEDAVGRPVTNAIGMTFVWIEPGTFLMGSPPDEPKRDGDEFQHPVTLTTGYYLQSTEVTQGQWQAVMGNNPSQFKHCGDDCPVENVSWDDALKFVKKLNMMEGGELYRLPSEAQWEYACRAGSVAALYAGPLVIHGERNAPVLEPITWYGGNSGVTYEGGYDSSNWKEVQTHAMRSGPHPVAMKAPNAWGLYDMIGNVWEWCQDKNGDYPTKHVTNPTGPFWGDYRVLRGGAWNDTAGSCRAATRNWYRPGYHGSYYGFRLLRDIE